MTFLQVGKGGSILLDIYVQPKSSSNRLGKEHGNSLKIYITAPPVDGKANKAVIAYFAKLFHLPKNAISIVSGNQSRSKRLSLSTCQFAAIKSIIKNEMQPD